MKALLLLYIANVLVLAIPLAFFEIWLENFKSGWDGEFTDPFWGRKIRWRWMNTLFEKAYVTPYHLVMFGAVIPGITFLEYWIFHILSGGSWLIMSFRGITIVAPIYIVAVWIGNAVVEDFFWFAFNSWFKFRFPDALDKLFRGEFKWHTKWVRVTRSAVLPRFYFTAPVVILGLMAAQEIVIRLCK